MKNTTATAAFMTACLLTTPALAQDSITAILAASNADTESALNITTVENLPDTDTCLNTAWVLSIKPPQWSYGRAITVQCMQNGHILAAQTCYAGECQAITLPDAMKP